MKRRNADDRFNPVIPVSEHSAYVDRIVGDIVAKATPPVPMGEFSAPEFSIEPVRGARAFDVDKLGRLTGVTHHQVWTPGENVSDCRANENDMSMTLTPMYASYGGPISGGYGFGGYLPRVMINPSWLDAPRPAGPHSLTACKCGFYGYYDGSNDYHKPERVSGVVEGYGEVVIGTRGFRSTKARIVALTIPDTVSPALAMRVRRNYRDIPFFDSFAAMVTEHPTDTQHGSTPETDPDFWTRP